MTRDERAAWDRALRAPRQAAFPLGEFVGQESFMDASAILALAEAAAVRRGVSVLDLCCGVAGPGRLVARLTGCVYLGVDASAAALALATARARDLPSARFALGHVPPLPPGRFDVVMLLETALAFADKPALLAAVAAALPVGGRLALTVEEGAALDATERAEMPAADTVWPWPLPELRADLDDARLEVRLLEECTDAHHRRATALLAAFEAHRDHLAADLGDVAARDLIVAHRLWVRWLSGRRIRKYAVVAQRTG